MGKVHFEIGNITDELWEGKNVTEKVFHGQSLTECLEEFKNRGYTPDDYFIDVWETDKDGTPYPIAEIDIDKWILEHYTN